MKLLALVVAVVCVCTAGCSRRDQMPDVRASEVPLVNKALDFYREGKISRSELLKSVNPVVVYLPNMTCVGLNSRDHVLDGSDTTICFDQSGKQVILYEHER